jgi:hypothetical protein
MPGPSAVGRVRRFSKASCVVVIIMVAPFRLRSAKVGLGHCAAHRVQQALDTGFVIEASRDEVAPGEALVHKD